MSSPVLRYASVLLLDVLWIDDLLCGGKAATHAERISAIWTSARAAYAAWEPTWRINAMQTTVEQSENVEMFEFGDIWRYKERDGRCNVIVAAGRGDVVRSRQTEYPAQVAIP